MRAREDGCKDRARKDNRYVKKERKKEREKENMREGKKGLGKVQDERGKEESKGQSGAKRAPQASKVFLQR